MKQLILDFKTLVLISNYIYPINPFRTEKVFNLNNNVKIGKLNKVSIESYLLKPVIQSLRYINNKKINGFNCEEIYQI